MERDFTPQEWDTCIKVLQILSRDPDQSMDTLVLKGLVTKLYKRAQRDKKQEASETFQRNLVIPDVLSIQKLRAISMKQDLLKQYDKKINFLHTEMVRKYQLPAAETLMAEGPLPTLLTEHKCYTCKSAYRELHFFYHLLCPTCATLNYARRTQRCDLTNRVAIVTGGRIKIGYLTALQLLRDGARVWVTTRFAKDCAIRFHQEPDFNDWGHRLRIVSLDLRNLHQVNNFIHQLYSSEQQLDIIIHNAAQTVKRPAAFYQHLFDMEERAVTALPAAVQGCVIPAAPFHFPADNVDLQLLPSEINQYFPEGRYDKDRQQIDLRTSNSWTLRLDEITPVEMLETQLVNVTAPFMLNSKLKPLLLQSPFPRKFIINVSAMEGQFNRSSKTCYHAHTNMAKAALNMMTRTAAQDYAQDGIYMNSVDTGWITQENPYQIKEQLYEQEGFVPPLDETDGMARIYDPIVSGITKPEIPMFGHFLKDYFPHAW